MTELIPPIEFTRVFEEFESNVSEIGCSFKQSTNYFAPSISLPEGYRLLQSSNVHTGKPDTEQIKIRLVFGDEVIYVVNLNVLGSVVNGKHCAQMMIWRTLDDAHATALIGFGRKMFEHLVEEYVVIVTDSKQTLVSRNFWEARIANAFKNSVRIYYTDMNELDGDMINIVHRVHSQEEFYNIWFDHGWGQTEEYKDRLFIISKNELS